MIATENYPVILSEAEASPDKDASASLSMTLFCVLGSFND